MSFSFKRPTDAHLDAQDDANIIVGMINKIGVNWRAM